MTTWIRAQRMYPTWGAIQVIPKIKKQKRRERYECRGLSMPTIRGRQVSSRKGRVMEKDAGREGAVNGDVMALRGRENREKARVGLPDRHETDASGVGR